MLVKLKSISIPNYPIWPKRRVQSLGFIEEVPNARPIRATIQISDVSAKYIMEKIV